MYKRSKIIFVVIALVAVRLVFVNLAPGARAHGFSPSFEVAIDGYLVDIGVDTPVFEAGVPAIIDFNLFQAEDISEVEFTNVLVRIISINDSPAPIFSGSFERAQTGLTKTTFTFPYGGDYELLVVFQKNGASLVKSSFSFSVEDPSFASPFIIYFATFGFGLFGGTLMARMFGKSDN